MAINGVGPRQGRVRELIELFEKQAASRGGVGAGSRAASGPSRSASSESLGSGMMDIMEVPNDAPLDFGGDSGRSPVAGLKPPSGVDSMESLPESRGTGVADKETESIGVQTPESVGTQTDPEVVEGEDPENKPLKGLDAFIKCFVGDKGFKGGALKLGKADVAAGITAIGTSGVMAPVHLASMVMDGPRKIGDVASAKGQKLIDGSKGKLGPGAVMKHLAGGLLKLIGGVARLGFPAIGALAMMFGGPPGLIIGLVFFGIYALKELVTLVTEGPDQMQTVRALRDLVSGALATVGTVIEGLFVKPIQGIVKRVRATPEPSAEPSVEGESSVAVEARKESSTADVEDPP